jgi:3'-phosphoadenosine 5'-phosphosulfate (PAPS) 3'-phosphatase
MNNKNKYPLLTQIVASAVNISQKSAKILYEVKQSGELNITEKKDEYDVVTRADFLSQLNIIKSIEHLFPKVKIWGEEGDLNDTYDESLNENVLNEAEFLPDVYNELREEDVIYILNIIFKFYIFLI